MMQSLLKLRGGQRVLSIVVVCLLVSAAAANATMRQPGGAPLQRETGGEANLVLPDLGEVSVLGVNARTLLMSDIGVCALGLIFGLMTFRRLKHLPVHGSM